MKTASVASSPTNLARTAQFRIIDAWTKAGFEKLLALFKILDELILPSGIASYVHVQGTAKDDTVLFDCGQLTTQNMLAKYVFITHGHIDHIGACVSHARGNDRLLIPNLTYRFTNQPEHFLVQSLPTTFHSNWKVLSILPDKLLKGWTAQKYP